jgi:hypothetical protein
MTEEKEKSLFTKDQIHPEVWRLLVNEENSQEVEHEALELRDRFGHEFHLDSPTKNLSVTSQLGRSLVLLDLLVQGWVPTLADQGTLTSIHRNEEELSHSERRIAWREKLQFQRDAQLSQPATMAFIHKLESRPFYDSIFRLMRDGRELAQSLRNGENAIDPYVQVIRGDELCPHTQIPLKSIWRYFRHTWSNPYSTVPGRSLPILIRDGAVDYHPVIGIAMLSSAPVQLSFREKHIGWTADQVQTRLEKMPPSATIDWFRKILDRRLGEIYTEDLVECPKLKFQLEHLRNPPAETELDIVQQLLSWARERREEHHRLPGEARRGTQVNPESQDWKSRAKTLLYQSKRAEELSSLLNVRRQLNRIEAIDSLDRDDAIVNWVQSDSGISALAKVLRIRKKELVGIDIADLSVCGAVAPYNEILGAKLVAMLAVSHEVREAFQEHYSGRPSVIASSMAGRPIRREVSLGYVGTTSLYGVRPCIYDRIALPGPVKTRIRFRYLGDTTGVGTFHFGKQTLKVLQALQMQRPDSEAVGPRVNFVFGEGSSPKLRAIQVGLQSLGFPASKLLLHGQNRSFYGVALAKNFRDYFMGFDQELIFENSDGPVDTVAVISEHWKERWLKNRLQKPGIIEAVESHDLVHPIEHGARVKMPEVNDPELTLFEF